MTTEPTAKAADTSDNDEGVMPFPEVPSADRESRGEDAGARTLGTDVLPYTDPEHVDLVHASEVYDGPPHIEKAHLVGQPFILRDVRVITDGAVADDTGEISDLVLFAGQAVDLDPQGKLRKLGYVFTCTAGAEHSVAGSQVLEDSMSAKRTGRAILYPLGFREAKATKGVYYTLRERAAKDQRVNLFDR